MIPVAHMKKIETPIDEIRRSWPDSMIRRRLHLDYLHLDDADNLPWKIYLEERIAGLECVLVDRGVPIRLDDGKSPARKTDLDRLMEIFGQFRDPA